MDLSKKDKKIARQIIETGYQRELEKGLSGFDTILTDWKEKKKGNNESYRLLYKKLTVFDKHIGRRYNNITGSRYYPTIASQLYDGIITQEDIKELSEEIIQKLNFRNSM